MDVSFSHFSLATAISLFKILTHTYVGSSVQTLVHANLHSLNPVALIAIITIPIVVFVPTSYFFWKEVKRKMSEMDLLDSSSGYSSSIELYSDDDVELDNRF
jgi:hypothetical protein